MTARAMFPPPCARMRSTVATEPWETLCSRIFATPVIQIFWLLRTPSRPPDNLFLLHPTWAADILGPLLLRILPMALALSVWGTLTEMVSWILLPPDFAVLPG